MARQKIDGVETSETKPRVMKGVPMESVFGSAGRQVARDNWIYRERKARAWELSRKTAGCGNHKRAVN